MKVLMLPHLTQVQQEESGIRRVIEAYFKHLPDYGVELVGPDSISYDLIAAHAGIGGKLPHIAHLHGLYWTGDYDGHLYEWTANEVITQAVRHARQITVPSEWVAETIRRDLRLNPHILPHGIDWGDWQHQEESRGFVLWNKNRTFDVCNPEAVNRLARIFPEVQFVSTFGDGNLSNIHVTGVIYHTDPQGEIDMKRLIQRCAVYLSTTKETFGIGTLEAMASGRPILGWNYGGNKELVQHGTNGYLAVPGNYEDLADGLVYCLKHFDTLGQNSREMALKWAWPRVAQQIASIYEQANTPEPPTVAVVIPVYQKTPEQLNRAVKSVLEQTCNSSVIVVNDASPDSTEIDLSMKEWQRKSSNISYIKHEHNKGVAHARNTGIAAANTKYICCLDADDWLEPNFLDVCIEKLEEHSSLGITYTKLKYYAPDGTQTVPDWPPQWNYDEQLQKRNQIPTACVFRREMWQRLGGYRQRYAPRGAGAEDAEFWLRSGAYGWGAHRVTEEPLFNYSGGGTVSADPNYREVDWTAWHPWTRDGKHPFASYARARHYSHEVRQYDEPIVSVIIPVGPGHEEEVINALDSLEAQTLRKWEAIVVWDTEKECVLERAYPYVRFAGLYKPGQGAGRARNSGVHIAKAPLILFLDADDTLAPDCLQKMVEAYNVHKMGIYTDYVGQAYISSEYALQLQQRQRLEYYDEVTQEAIIRYQAFNFDCQRALKLPNDTDFYIWNLITTLIPKQWHEEIGGFDEELKTWEDWDYWIRMAKQGKCFHRLSERLVRYRVHTGSRRNLANADTESGRQIAQDMIELLIRKHERVKDMGCGCGGRTATNGTAQASAQQQQLLEVDMSDFVKARYIGRRGNHRVNGAFKFDHRPAGVNSREDGFGKYFITYGYFSEGWEGPVHKEDVRLMVGKWKIIEDVQPVQPQPVPVTEPAPIQQAIPSPQPVAVREGKFDLQTIPGISPLIAKRLEEEGLNTPEAIKQAGVDGLTEIRGVALARAKLILEAVEDK